MASPQLENGYTPIANEIMEALMQINLSPYESRVLWFILRKTYGWGKKSDYISLSQFSDCIGLDRRLVHRALKQLSSKKMIVISKDDTYKISYGFQKDYKKWEVSSVKMTVISKDDGLSSGEMTKVSSVEIPTKTSKETITKENIYIILASSKLFEVTPEMIQSYRDAYPNIDVISELKECRQWNHDNKSKRKTESGMPRHINAWLSRANKEVKSNGNGSGPPNQGSKRPASQVTGGARSDDAAYPEPDQY